MAEWGVVRLSRCITAGPKSVSAGNGRPLACAAVLQPVPISCHFQGCTVPLQQFVCDSVTLISVLHFHFTFSKQKFQHSMPRFLTFDIAFFVSNITHPKYVEIAMPKQTESMQFITFLQIIRFYNVHHRILMRADFP